MTEEAEIEAMAETETGERRALPEAEEEAVTAATEVGRALPLLSQHSRKGEGRGGEGGSTFFLRLDYCSCTHTLSFTYSTHTLRHFLFSTTSENFFVCYGSDTS